MPATPPDSPATEGDDMSGLSLGTILKGALIAGLAAAMTTAIFHLIVTEPLIDQAIALEETHHQEGTAEGEHQQPIVSRQAQKGGLVAGFLIYGLVWSLLMGIAYHAAHYLSYLLLAGQLAIPLASDPFGWGWDLFGTRDYEMDLGLISMKTVWTIAVVAIVAGHVISVTLAHVEALRLFPTRRAALLSQLPMLALMVAFTSASLWIMSQPIVELD